MRLFGSVQFTSDYGLGKVAVAAFGLGAVTTVHAAGLAYYVSQVVAREVSDRAHCGAIWCCYMLALCFFHLSEFMVTAAWKPSTVSYESFLLNHSREYHFALGVSWLEFLLEAFFWPSWKVHAWLVTLGVAVVGMGQVLRIMAMWTAASNFSHRIEIHKREGHVLVTHGVYRCMRHPSYSGWLTWSVGSQLLLANPICLVGYTFVSWSFFRNRIPFEEELLLEFFPEQYPKYQAVTWSGIPFVA